MTQQLSNVVAGNAVTWPPQVVDRIKRVFEFHQQTKTTAQQPHSSPDERNQPRAVQVFESATKVPLPTNLIPADVPTISLLLEGREAVPHSRLDPPHDMRTLATWLFLANGITKAQRTVPSNADTYPCDIYVAAFSIDGLTPGLYYYNPREFSLRCLRDGLQAIATMIDGQPEMAFLSHVPAAFLVSTVFARSTWHYQSRGYRAALLDAGRQIENLVQAGTAIGAYTDVRLSIMDQSMRRLIGVPDNASFEQAEAVQAVVTWSDPEPAEVQPPQGPVAPWPAIVREPSQAKVVAYDLVPLVHEDCVAAGNLREIRPPLTETATVPPSAAAVAREPAEPPHGGTGFGPLVMKRQVYPNFAPRPIMRDNLLAINLAALGGPSYHPLLPASRHASLVRPLWLMQNVVGLEPGVWYYHPQTDRWVISAQGLFKEFLGEVTREKERSIHAAAICVLIADLRHLMVHAGPDAYRLAHLEAGIVAHRLQLGAESLGLHTVSTVDFYDDPFREFFGLGASGWEIMYQVLIGYGGNPDESDELEVVADDADPWLD